MRDRTQSPITHHASRITYHASFLRLLSDLGIQSVLTTIAQNADGNLGPGQLPGDDPIELHARCYWLTVDGSDQIVLAKTGARGRRGSRGGNRARPPGGRSHP